jgi:hypothetical protein
MGCKPIEWEIPEEAGIHFFSIFWPPPCAGVTICKGTKPARLF